MILVATTLLLLGLQFARGLQRFLHSARLQFASRWLAEAKRLLAQLVDGCQSPILLSVAITVLVPVEASVFHAVGDELAHVGVQTTVIVAVMIELTGRGGVDGEEIWVGGEKEKGEGEGGKSEHGQCGGRCEGVVFGWVLWIGIIVGLQLSTLLVVGVVGFRPVGRWDEGLKFLSTSKGREDDNCRAQLC